MTIGQAGKRTMGLITALAVLSACPFVRLSAQQSDVRAQLTARGLPAPLAQSVATISAEASARGLPVEPLVAKAIEGFAKRVPAARIETAVRELSTRLGTARDALVSAGVRDANGALIAASAEAMARGIGTSEIMTVIRAAPSGEAASTGLSVAAALASRGLSQQVAVQLVVESFRAGHSVAQVLDLPAAAAALVGRGMAPADVGRRLLEGIGAGAGVQGSGRSGAVVRPPAVPPAILP